MAPTQKNEAPEQLYAAAVTFVEQGQHEDALQNAQKLFAAVKNRGPADVLPALNLLGEINVELGDIDAAREYFEQAVALDPDGIVPETSGGGAEKFMWLAQLCDEGGSQSVHWFERGVKALQHEIATLENGKTDEINSEVGLIMRMEKKRKLANALCGIIEVYMTDLSWESDAETRCENLITEAMSVEDETSPEVLQTLASIRLSQQRKEDAQSALKQSLEIWKDMDPEDPEIPDFATRISLARLLMEAEMEDDGLNVLNRLIQEDDQSVEAWYLGGWCQHLMAERDKERVMVDDDSQNGNVAGLTADLESLLKGSQHWLNRSIKLYGSLDYEDNRLLDHAKELVGELDKVLGPEQEQTEDAESEDEWTGFDDDDVDEEMEDL